MFAVFTKAFAVNEGLVPPDPRLEKLFRHLTLETGPAARALMVLAGFAGSVLAVGLWGEHSFGALDPSRTLRVIVPSITLLLMGFQTLLSNFFLSVLGLNRK